VRAGALAAKDPLVEVLAEQAGRGVPVLGICNGAQVLVEAGWSRVVRRRARPGAQSDAGPRRYFSRWVHVRIEASPCVSRARSRPGAVAAVRGAREGRFARSPRVAPVPLAAGRTGAAALLDRRWAAGGGLPGQPEWIGGSDCGDVQCARNVLAIMPHPERPRTSVR